ncbi:MAG: DUF4268 domain-containing protein [Candidatus Omnitrophica bacterium]|nr:DUF4268 domain-containing protein [Candidatus Omnitrophota bacterium]
MAQLKQIYLAYWRQLKFFVDEQGLDWKFSSFEGEGEAVVKIGDPKRKICLSLNGSDGKKPQPVLSAGFWIPDSREEYMTLKAKRAQIEAEMGKSLVWDMRPGRKSSWVWITIGMDLSNEKNWPSSFEWFAQNAQKIRDVCQRHLS